jgi:hypothetical protein
MTWNPGRLGHGAGRNPFPGFRCAASWLPCYDGGRDLLTNWDEKKGEADVGQYWADKNQQSLAFSSIQCRLPKEMKWNRPLARVDTDR